MLATQGFLKPQPSLAVCTCTVVSLCGNACECQVQSHVRLIHVSRKHERNCSVTWSTKQADLMPRTQLVTAVVIAVVLATPASAIVSTCPDGWTFFDDATGSPAYQEGHHSCVIAVNNSALGWSAATASCPDNGHLLSIGSSEPKDTNALYNFAYELTAGVWDTRGGLHGVVGG